MSKNSYHFHITENESLFGGGIVIIGLVKMPSNYFVL